MKAFIEFIKKQGVVGLAIGFILGGAVSNIVSSLVTNIINPVLGLVLGAGGSLTQIYFTLGPAKILVGSFLSTLLDFLIIALVVYLAVKLLKLD